MKRFVHPITGHHFYGGRRHPKTLGAHLKLREYLRTASLPYPPQKVNYGTPASSSLGQMYLNDQLGDCVIAMMGHTAGVLTAGADNELLLTRAQVIALYSAIGGYVPGYPETDQGCDEVTAFNFWRRCGLMPGGAHKIAGWMAVDGTDKLELRTALWLFENLQFGMDLPDAWVDPFPEGTGFRWEVAGPPIPENGHAFSGFGYNRHRVLISTWGMVGNLPWNAIATYGKPSSGGGVYVVLSEDAINKAQAKAPNGLSWDQLRADFRLLQGTGQPVNLAEHAEVK
jgi:hypothetical protein